MTFFVQKKMNRKWLIHLECTHRWPSQINKFMLFNFLKRYLLMTKTFFTLFENGNEQLI